MRKILIGQQCLSGSHPEPAGRHTGREAFYKHAQLWASECTWVSYFTSLPLKRLPLLQNPDYISEEVFCVLFLFYIVD